MTRNSPVIDGKTNRVPRSAYVHVPFCQHRCGYCNFTVIAGRDELIDTYLDCLAAELQQHFEGPRHVKTLFLGGGTPTHLSPGQLERLLTLLQQWLPIAEGGEYSVEANPLDCDDERLRIMRDYQVNRLSLGGQSFNDPKLRWLERDHSGQQLQQAIERANKFLPNISLDLIFAVPGETREQWSSDLDIALSLPLKHLSTYGLTFEPGARFWGLKLRGQIVEVDEELQLSNYQHAIDRITGQGWQHYEVSNFCMPGFACRHNQTYWQGDYWWAFGPGASSFLPRQLVQTIAAAQVPVIPSEPSLSQQFVRATNHRSTTGYLQAIQAGRSPIHEIDYLDLQQVIRERLVFGLRQLDGVDFQALDQQWGGSARLLFEPYLSQYIDQGLLEQNERLVRLTSRGLMISDSLWPNLLDPSMDN